MKKIFTLLSLALVAFMAQAESTSVSIHVDDPSHVAKFKWSGQEYTFDSEGYLYFTVEEGTSAQGVITTVEPWVLSDQSYYIEGEWTNNCYTYFKNKYEFNVYGGYSDEIKYEFFTVDNTELRKNVAKIIVHGDPTKLSMSDYYSYQSKNDFVEGENLYKFMDAENYVSFGSANYNQPLYKVEKNGTEVTPDYTTYYVTLDNGDEIDVYTEWPDKDITVTFEFKGDAGRKSISYFSIGGVTYTDFSEPIVAKMGQTYSLSLASINYETTLFTVNDEPLEISSWGSGDNGTLTEDLHYVIEQTKKPCYTANVTVDDCSRIYYREAGIDLYPTSNTFEVEVAKDNATYNPLYFYPIDYTCQIDEITVDGEPAQYSSYDRSFNVELQESTKEINVKTSHLDRDGMFSFYFNSPDKASYACNDQYGLSGWWLSCQFPRTEMQQNIKAGYNFIDFGLMDGQFQFGVYGSEDDIKKYVHGYLNNEKLDVAFTYSEPALFTPNNGDSFKVFVSEEAPVFYTAVFGVEEEAAVKGAYVDGIKEIEVGDKVEFTELQETGFSLLIAEGYIVKLNGEEIDPMEEPVENVSRGVESKVYYFDLVKDTDVRIVKEESGIDSISVEENAANPAVYNMLGVKVSNGSTDNLPSGIYVQKGRKIYVK